MKHTDMFKPRTHFVPARIEEPDMDDEDQSPIVIPIKQKKQSRYCGEKLLRKLKKDRQKEEHKIDVAQISKSLSHIMRDF